MTLKVDGTNGLLQQYDYQVLTTGFTYTFAAGTTVLVINPAGTLATGTITFPASPVDGMTVTFSSTQQITALTLSGNGKTIVSAVTFLPANQATTYVYRLSNTTWYPMATVAGTGSQLISGTVQNSTSGTSIDFTLIPSWVKRITVMFNGVSTNNTSNLLVQLGYQNPVTSTGYVSTCAYNGSGTLQSVNSTAGFVIVTQNASQTVYGQLIISLIGSNIWVASGNITNSTTASSMLSGGVTLSGTLDRVRITSVTPDTFDAGSINILYE